MTIEEMLDLAAHVEDLDGLELVSNWLRRLFADRNLRVCVVVPDLWTQAKWAGESLASPDAGVRQETAAEIERSIDWAEAAARLSEYGLPTRIFPSSWLSTYLR